MQKNLKIRIMAGTLGVVMGIIPFIKYTNSSTDDSNSSSIMENDDASLNTGPFVYQDGQYIVSYGDYIDYTTQEGLQKYLNSSTSHTYQSLSASGVVFVETSVFYGPGCSFGSYNTLREDTPFEVLGVCDNGWYMIRCRGVLGFVSGDFVRIIDYDLLEEQMNQILPTHSYIKTVHDDNPIFNDSDVEVDSLRKGEILLVVSHTDDGRYQFFYNGEYYFISDSDVVPYTLGEATPTFVYAICDTSIYEDPYGSPAFTVSAHELFPSYGEIDDYYLVEKDGKFGFLKKIDSNSLEKDFLLIDISDKMITLYQNGAIVYSCDFLTSIGEDFSHFGSYAIYLKKDNVLLKNYPIPYFVDCWLSYLPNIGIGMVEDEDFISSNHESFFLSQEDASFLYQSVDEGDKVLIRK